MATLWQIVLPVDPVAVGRELGIEVLDDDEIPPEVCSVCRKKQGLQAAQILLSPTGSHDLRRFPCAVALGHYSRSVEFTRDGSWELVETRDLLSSLDRDADWTYAIEFAAELLMPRIALREHLDTGSTVALASAFGVTGDVMNFRLGSASRSPPKRRTGGSAS